MAHGRHIASICISTKNHPISMKFGTQQHIWNLTKYDFMLNLRWRRPLSFPLYCHCFVSPRERVMKMPSVDK